MSKSNQFLQYAEEAMLSARHSIDEIEKLALLDLARLWTQASLQSESIFTTNNATGADRKTAQAGEAAN
jgi:hypothetical protein